MFLKNTAIWITLLVLTLAFTPALAFDTIPTTTGWAGFAIVSVGVFKVENNMIVTGPPLLGDAGNTQISSIFDSPSSRTAAAMLFGGELNYTFASTRTQVFLGTRLEDVLRLDVAFGLGARQKFPDKSILAASVLFTPIKPEVWSDPYVEGVDRVGTLRDKPGARLRWTQVLKTNLELTATVRSHRHENETSGDFLFNRGDLTSAEVSSLSRNGEIWRLQALYQINIERRHRLEPAIRYILYDLDGDALSHTGVSLQLTYLYFTPSYVLDTNLILHTYESDATHPVYGEVLKANRYGFAFSVFYDLFKRKGWRAFAGVEYVKEDSNIAFFDSKISSIAAGVIWRYARQ